MPVPVLAGGLIFFVRMSDTDVVNAENAGAFFCRRKVAKRKPCLLPVLLAFIRGCQKGFPVPFDKVRLPCSARHTRVGVYFEVINLLYN
jgi:hypothetical protein